jgi:hypothetical protein
MAPLHAPAEAFAQQPPDHAWRQLHTGHLLDNHPHMFGDPHRGGKAVRGRSLPKRRVDRRQLVVEDLGALAGPAWLGSWPWYVAIGLTIVFLPLLFPMDDWYRAAGGRSPG